MSVLSKAIDRARAGERVERATGYAKAKATDSIEVKQTPLNPSAAAPAAVGEEFGQRNTSAVNQLTEQRKQANPGAKRAQERADSAVRNLSGQAGGVSFEEIDRKNEERKSQTRAIQEKAKNRPATAYTVEKAQTDLQDREKRLKTMESRITAARRDAEDKGRELDEVVTRLQSYQSDSRLGSDEIVSAGYRNLLGRYETLTQEFQTAAASHDKLMAAYESAAAEYQSRYTAYKKLMAGQGERVEQLQQKYEQARKEADDAQRIAASLTRGPADKRDEWTKKAQEAENRAENLRRQADQARGLYYSAIPMLEDYDSRKAPEKGATYSWRFWEGDDLYNFINDVPEEKSGVSYRDYIEGEERHSHSTGGKYGAYTPYSYMTEDEVGIYNYLYATKGKKAAETFLGELENQLNYRQGKADYENLSGVGKALYWIPSGIDNAIHGLAQPFSEKALPNSPSQYTGQMVREEAGSIHPALGFAYDLGATISNMAPSILLGSLAGGIAAGAGAAAGTAGAISSGVSSATMGLSAGGNAYTQKVNEGYTPRQARSYATLVGASEGALQYLLGGITSMGGVSAEQALGKLAPKIAAIDNALLRTVVDGGVRLGVKGVSEGMEEGLQELLEPAFATLILGEDYNWGENFENAAYSFLMGFLTSGVFEGVGLAAEAAARKASRFDPKMDGYMGSGDTDYFAGCTTAEEVETKYRELARKHHPDLGGDESTMADINRQHDMRKAWFAGRQQAAEKTRTQEQPQEQAQGEDVNPLALLAGEPEVSRESVRTVTPEAPQAQENALQTAQAQENVLKTTQAQENVLQTTQAQENTLQTAQARETAQGVDYVQALRQAGADEDTARMAGNWLKQAEQGAALTESQRAYIAAAPGGAELVNQIQPLRQGQGQQQQAGPGQEGQDITQGTTAPNEDVMGIYEENQITEGLDNGGQQQRDGVSDGESGRYAGAGAGEQAGGLAEGPAGAAPPAEQGRAAVGRQNRVAHLRAEKVRTAQLGLPNGTEKKAVAVIQPEAWDEGLRATAERVQQETGLPVTFVLGKLPMMNQDGSVTEVRGVYTPERIFVQADNVRATADQLADHEIFHDKAFRTPGMVWELEQRIIEKYGREEFGKVVAVYAENLRGILALPEYATMDEIEAAYLVLYEEILADAYAGINAFSAHAEKFQEDAYQFLEEKGIGTGREAARATDRTTGPPEVRYSTEDIDSGEAGAYNGEKDETALTGTEERAVLDYKSGGSYQLNAALRDGYPLNQSQYKTVEALDTALKKLPTYQGTVYRRIGFDSIGGQEALNAFLEEHQSGRLIQYPAYTSTSTDPDGYRVEGALTVSMIIEGRGGRDMEGYGNNFESEVLFPRDSCFYIERVETDSEGKPVIYAREVTENGAGQFYPEKRSEAVQQMQEEKRGKAVHLRGVPEVDSEGGADGRLPGLRAGRAEGEGERGMAAQLQKGDGGEGRAAQETPEGRGVSTPDIRYSVDDEGLGWDVNSQKRQEIQKEREAQELKARTVGKQEFKRQQRETARQVTEQAREQAKKRKPIAESKAIIAKKDLRQNLLSLFSIPEGRRAELGSVIDQTAERLMKNGTLTQADRDAFFQRMYDAGVMTVQAEDYYAEARNAVKGGKVYVSQKVKNEFGSDWNDFRKKAFSLGVYFTNNPRDNGIDSWNMELAEMMPGFFDLSETDDKTILKRIVQAADEGRDENLSLAEYTALLAGREFIREEDILENMERQMDWALRTFAEKAELEIKLRDRTGVKIAQERERHTEQETKLRDRMETKTTRERERHTEQEAKLRDRMETKLAQERERHIEQEQRRKMMDMMRRRKEKEERRQKIQRQKENRILRETQQSTLKQLQWLAKNRHRAPEELREAFDQVLGDIDIYAVNAASEMNWSNKYQATWKDLAQLYKTAQESDPNFIPSAELERIVKRLDGDKIGDMDIDALKDLYKAAVGLRTEFYNRNNLLNDEKNRLFSEVYADSKTEIETAPGGFTGKGTDRLMNLEQLTPMNVMERMGGWNPEGAFYSMAKQLEKGERDVRGYTVKATKHLAGWLTENADWVRRADGQGKDAIWYEIEVPEMLELRMGDKPIFGDTVKVYMTPSMKVHMYLESKNYDNLRHMAGGRTFADRELYSQGKRREAFAQGKTIKLAPETVHALTTDLTVEERQLADLLWNYYNVLAKGEINRVSNILYGYDKAQSGDYAPIYTNQNYVKSEIGVFDATAEGVGNLKSRQYSKNPSYNIGAFDAFERHMEQTARFVGMAIPARNWQNLLNWRERGNSMGDVITHKWGKEGKDYIETLLTRLQGGTAAERDTVGSFADKVLSNYIASVFGFNFSIVAKQLGSIPLAAAYLGATNAPINPAQIHRIDRELIAKYTGDLEWRTMGYSTPETKMLKENPNWTQRNKAVQFTFGGGAITAMDGWAASVLWPWAENKVRKEFPNLEVGTQEQINAGQSPFYQKVAEEFNEAVARSQSVSDEIHQGTLRKSRNPITRALTMFKSDSAQAYNALRQKAGEARYYQRIGDKEKAGKTRRALGVAFTALVGGYLWAAIVNLMNALWKNKGKYYRDDEGELTYESVAEELAGDLLSNLAGVMVGGEELFDIIGSALTGDNWNGIDTPGLEQVIDIVETLQKVVVEGLGWVRDGADVVKNGGDLGEYLSRHSGDILGGIKKLAETAATYIPGIPVKNLEAYILGTVRWISPELGTAYDDLLKTATKGGLSGLEGDALEQRVGSILSGRLNQTPEGAAEELAALYAAGYKKAVPTDTPSKITVNGEEQELAAHQRQIYETVWRESVEKPLAELLGQDWYRSLGDEDRAKVLAKLYEYGAESAKGVLFQDYQPDSFTEKVSAFRGAGLDTEDCLEVWRKFAEIDDGPGTASERATEFAYWVDSQGYTDQQARVVKDSFTVFSHLPVTPKAYETMQGAGLSDSEARELTERLGKLEPEGGADSVSDLQRLRAIAEAGLSQEKMLAAMGTVLGTEQVTESGGKSQYALLQDALDDGLTVEEWLELKEAGYMTESAYSKVRLSGQYDISPSQYIRYREMLVSADAMNANPEKRNGSIDQSEAAAAINGMLGLTNEQKAVLWQIQNKSWKPNKNPFSRTVGQAVYNTLNGEGLNPLGLPSLGG